MKLNRRYLRNIGENLSFYIAATVLTVATLFLYFMFNVAGNAILDFGDEFFARNKVEDAHFSTYMPIPDERIEELEDEYGLTLEAQRYINIETDDITARVFERTEKVDLYEITVGRDIENDGELVISEGYAVENGIELGDSVKIGEEEYEIVGFMQRPDYLYMLENEDDSYKNVTTFFLCCMSGDDFEKLNATGVQYLVRYGEDADSAEFRKAVHKDYYMRSYTSAGENNRILMVDQQAELFIIMSYLLLCILPVVAVILVSIIISRKVKAEQRMIGTLSALGYKKGQLTRHYEGFAVLPGLIGGVLTAALTAAFVQPLSEIGLQDYEPMRIVGHLKPLDAALGIIVPTGLYVLSARLSVRKLLKKDTVLLLSGGADGDKKRLRRAFTGSRMKWGRKFAFRSLVGNPMRSFVVLLGIFLGCFIMLLGQGFYDAIEHAGTEAADTLGSFEHEYLLNELLDENPYGGETLLVASVEDEDGAAVSVIGTRDGNPYFAPKDAEGNAVSIEDGYYITSLVQMTLGWQEGDTVTLLNPRSLEEHSVTVAGVIQNNVQKAIYTSKALAAELTGLDESKYNCIVSAEKLSIPEAKIAQEVLRTDITDQTKTMTGQMQFLVDMIIGLGVIICVAAVYVAVNMLISESRSSISMLKVLGYDDRRIDRIVLSSHHILLPLGILLSIPAAYAAGRTFFVMMVDYGVMLIDMYIEPQTYIISIGLTAACYFGSLWLLRGKVKRIDMIESLKDNRE